MNKKPEMTLPHCKATPAEMQGIFADLGYKGKWKAQKLTLRFESASLDATFWVKDRRLGLSGAKAEEAFDRIIPYVSGTQIDFSECVEIQLAE